MTALALFVSALLTVFFLSFQQQNVIGRHFAWAAVTSIGIGACQVTLWRLVPGASWFEIAATLAGGPVGVVLAMWAHPRIVLAKQAKDGAAAVKALSEWTRDRKWTRTN